MSETPNGSKLFALSPEGVQTEVTEGVLAAFDLATGSLDMGSGFWTIEDTEPLAMLEEVCGFNGGCKAYIAAQVRSQELAGAANTMNYSTAGAWDHWVKVGHAEGEHIFSPSTGVCLHWNCKEAK
jgi:hypothetical protein